MSTVTRLEFLISVRRGVRLDDALEQEIAASGVGIDQFRALDDNADGILAGRELRAAYELIDDHDRNGLRASFRNAGTAGQLYRALRANLRPEPTSEHHGADIAEAARNRVVSHGAEYAFGTAPTSPYPNLSGNTLPGQTRVAWLASQNKCNQFVGDVLTDAGMQMPTFLMADGSEHYANAEALPRFGRHFDRVTSKAALQPGDVIVIDHPAIGESTAHAEIVVATTPELMTVGAHSGGASESDFGFPAERRFVRSGRYWEMSDGDRIYVLRPKRPL